MKRDGESHKLIKFTYNVTNKPERDVENVSVGSGKQLQQLELRAYYRSTRGFSRVLSQNWVYEAFEQILPHLPIGDSQLQIENDKANAL